jgi:putative heme-binding domain-containing protein
MDPTALEIHPVPPLAELASRPMCLTLLTYGAEGPAVAAFWWDDTPLHEQGVRLVEEDGQLGGPVTPDDDLDGTGWWAWLVGDEVPWHHDPRVSVANVQALGERGTPADVVRALRRMLEDEPEPNCSREHSLAAIVHKLPFWPPAEDELDLIEAAARRDDPEIARQLRRIDEARPHDDPLSPYRETLVGGDAERGWKVFSEKAEVECIRCHKARDRGGEVGPDLNGIGARQDRRQILESIVVPDRQIAKGFETIVVASADGQVHTGIVKEDTPNHIRLITPEGKFVSVPRADIEEQRRGASAMPQDLTKHLSRSEVRDLVEFLATLK